MTARFVGRAAGVDGREVTRLPRGQQRRQRRVQAEETVEVNCAFVGGGAGVVWAGDAERRTQRIVGFFAMRDEDVERVGGPAQEDDDERIPTRLGLSRVGPEIF